MMKKGTNSNSKKSNHHAPKKGMKPKEQKFFVSDAAGKPVRMRRKLTYITTDVAVTGNPLTYSLTTGTVTSALEWANLSSTYEQYRVRAMKVRIIPRTRDNMNSSALIWYPGTLVSGTFPAGSGGSTLAAIFGEDGSKLHPEWSIAEHMATWESNLDAQLWTDCNASIPTLSQYGIQFYSTVVGPVSYNGLSTHDIFVEFDVEFLGRN